MYVLQIKIKFWLNLSCPSYSWVISAGSLKKMTIYLGWKILQKNFNNFDL